MLLNNSKSVSGEAIASRKASRLRMAIWIAGGLILVALAGTAAFAHRYRVLLPDGDAGFTLIREESWPPPSARIMVIAPHPDDEILGGEMVLRQAVRRGQPARVVVVTCGDGFIRAASTYFHHRASYREMVQFGEVRQQETLHASRALGLSADHVAFLGFPDGGVDALWNKYWSPASLFRSDTTGVDHVPYPNAVAPGAPYCGQALLAEMVAQIREFKPTDIYVSHPWDDHPDHYATNFFVMAALNTLSNEPFARSVTLHPYLVHAGFFPKPKGYWPVLHQDPPTPLRTNGLTWSELRLSPGQEVYRLHLIDLYHTQIAMTRPSLEGFVRRDVLFGDTPEFHPRRIATGTLAGVRWRRADTYYSYYFRHSPQAKNVLLTEEAVSTPRGLVVRIQSTAPAAGTLVRVMLHPLWRSPGPERLASLRPTPVPFNVRLLVVTIAGNGTASAAGVERLDRGHVITILLPNSVFGRADRTYIDVRLSHGGHALRAGRARLLTVDTGESSRLRLS